MDTIQSDQSKFLIFVPEYNLAYNLLKKLLVKYNVDNQNLINELEKLQTLSSENKHFIFDNQFLLETKYYIAKITIVILLYSFSIEAAEKSYQQQFKQLQIGEPDALGFLIKIENKNQIGYTQFTKVSEQILKEYDPSLQFLFIDRKVNEHMEVEIDAKSQVYIEYIYDDLESEKKDKEEEEEKNDQKRSPFEERFGIDRLMEIIECNLWKGLQKTKGQEKLQEIKKQEIEKKAQIEQKLNTLTEEEKQAQEEIEMEQFQELITNMKNLKEIGKTLNDEERKKQAETLITQMANLIGGLSDDDDGDSPKENKVK